MSNKTSRTNKKKFTTPELDLSFGEGGRVTVPHPDYSAPASPVVLAADPLTKNTDQRTYAYISDGASYTTHVTRLLADGSVDTRFGSNGYVLIPVPKSDTEIFPNPLWIEHFVFSESGAITCLGYSYVVINGIQLTYTGAARITPSGQLDTSFGNSGSILYSLPIPAHSNDDIHSEHPGIKHAFFWNGVDGRNGQGPHCNKVTTVEDGKLLFLAYAHSRQGNSFSYLARMNIDGSLDTTFGTSGLVLIKDPDGVDQTLTCRDYSIDRKGGITVVSYGESAEDGRRLGIVVRYDAEGTLDRTFGKLGVAHFSAPDKIIYPRQVQVFEDGSTIISSAFFDSTAPPPTTRQHCGLVKLLANGNLDQSFNNSNPLYIDLGEHYETLATAIAIDAGNRIVISGYRILFEDQTIYTTGFLSRCMPFGIMDDGFGDKGIAVFEELGPMRSAIIHNRTNDNNTNIVVITQRISGDQHYEIARYLA